MKLRNFQMDKLNSDGFFKEAERNAVKINLQATSDFVRKLQLKRRGKIISPYPTINGVNIEFSKKTRCFEFQAEGIALHVGGPPPVEFQHIFYGYTEPFYIVGDDLKLFIENGINTISISLGKGLSAVGTFSNVISDFENTKAFYRSIQPIRDDSKVPLDYMLGNSFKIGDALRFHGYITLKIGDFEFGYYDFDFLGEKCIFIDALSPIEYNDFQQNIDVITYSFGLISGSLNRDERLILKSNEKDFSEIMGFKFNKMEDSLISNFELINPKELNEWMNISSGNRFSHDVFSYLSLLCLNDKRIFRAIKVITQSRMLPVELSVAAFFVSLETIKNVIIEKNEDSVSPFKSKVLALKTIASIKEMISSIKESEFNNKLSVLRKIDDLNKIGNNESFFKVFELLGIKLGKKEKDCLRMRNRFLHGNVPFDDEIEKNQLKEMNGIKFRAHFLTCALILKYAGFNGYMKNLVKFTKLKQYDSIDEPLFKLI